MKPPEQVSDSVRRLNPALYQPAPQAEHEDKLREEVLQEIRDRVWKAFAGTTARATGRTLGEPDIICAADRGRTLYVELKTKTGKLSADQQAVHAHLRKLGHQVYVVRSLQEFKEIADARINGMEATLQAIRTLNITADTLFERIYSDLGRGLKCEARSHLNFLDELADRA